MEITTHRSTPASTSTPPRVRRPCCQDHRPHLSESRRSPQAGRYKHLCPYLNQEVPSPQSGLPCHPAFIHGLQVLQGWERRRWRELLNGRIRWEGRTDSSFQTWQVFPRWQPRPPRTPRERLVCLLLEVGGPGQPSPGKGLTLTVMGQTNSGKVHSGPASYRLASLLRTRAGALRCACLYVHACHSL